MLGSPIAHSRSPQLHLAAYRALGLDGWTYDRIECTAEELPGLLAGFGPEWVGVSVTMPGKFAALRFADERTARAELVGSANTLVRSEAGWRADNTDIDGVKGALGPVVGRAAVLGSGGTAPAVVVGLADLGVQDISVLARNRDKAAPLLAPSAACPPARRAVRRVRMRTSGTNSTGSDWARRRCCCMGSTILGLRRGGGPSRRRADRSSADYRCCYTRRSLRSSSSPGCPRPSRR